MCGREECKRRVRKRCKSCRRMQEKSAQQSPKEIVSAREECKRREFTSCKRCRRVLEMQETAASTIADVYIRTCISFVSFSTSALVCGTATHSCFTGTKVQMLTHSHLKLLHRSSIRCGRNDEHAPRRRRRLCMRCCVSICTFVLVTPVK